MELWQKNLSTNLRSPADRRKWSFFGVFWSFEPEILVLWFQNSNRDCKAPWDGHFGIKIVSIALFLVMIWSKMWFGPRLSALKKYGAALHWNCYNFTTIRSRDLIFIPKWSQKCHLQKFWGFCSFLELWPILLRYKMWKVEIFERRFR